MECLTWTPQAGEGRRPAVGPGANRSVTATPPSSKTANLRKLKAETDGKELLRRLRQPLSPMWTNGLHSAPWRGRAGGSDGQERLGFWPFPTDPRTAGLCAAWEASTVLPLSFLT
jgi:hypothetical protein